MKLIGDLPIFVSAESADVWAAPHLFLLDRHRRPTAVAGVPPDYFSATGQRWGNPLYDWAGHASATATPGGSPACGPRSTRRTWSASTTSAGSPPTGTSPPASPRPSAAGGSAAPGPTCSTPLRKALGHLPFIAEDLGLITPDVETLCATTSACPACASSSSPSAATPTTPSSRTTTSPTPSPTPAPTTTTPPRGWYASLTPEEKTRARRYAPGVDKDPAGALIRLAWQSVADRAIAPLQDVLRLGSQARMNLPGTGQGNWGWRLPTTSKIRGPLDSLAELTETYGRRPNPPRAP